VNFSRFVNLYVVSEVSYVVELECFVSKIGKLDSQQFVFQSVVMSSAEVSGKPSEQWLLLEEYFTSVFCISEIHNL